MTELLGVPPEQSPGYTDAAVLGKRHGMIVCNFAVGYTRQHTAQETLQKEDYRHAQEDFSAILKKYC